MKEMSLEMQRIAAELSDTESALENISSKQR